MLEGFCNWKRGKKEKRKKKKRILSLLVTLGMLKVEGMQHHRLFISS